MEQLLPKIDAQNIQIDKLRRIIKQQSNQLFDWELVASREEAHVVKNIETLRDENSGLRHQLAREKDLHKECKGDLRSSTDKNIVSKRDLASLEENFGQSKQTSLK